MAKSINQVLVMGNLTADPKISTTPAGHIVAVFSVALNRSYKDKNDEWQESTDYTDVVAWGVLAENVQQRLGKGNRCIVNGRLQSRNWEDKETGGKRSKLEVLAEDIVFLDKAE